MSGFPQVVSDWEKSEFSTELQAPGHLKNAGKRCERDSMAHGSLLVIHLW